MGPFVRGHRACDQAGHGWGLGLTIAQGICRAHGGELTVDSCGEGQGSTLTITLPSLAAV
jgi:histidine kinase